MSNYDNFIQGILEKRKVHITYFSQKKIVKRLDFVHLLILVQKENPRQLIVLISLIIEKISFISMITMELKVDTLLQKILKKLSWLRFSMSISILMNW